MMWRRMSGFEEVGLDEQYCGVPMPEDARSELIAIAEFLQHADEFVAAGRLWERAEEARRRRARRRG